MCFILKSEGALSSSYQVNVGQATVQNNLVETVQITSAVTVLTVKFSFFSCPT